MKRREGKENIVVVGLQSGKLTGFIEKLAQENFRMLIVPGNEGQESRMRDDMKGLSSNLQVELQDFPTAVRAADVIAFINPHDWDSDLIDRMKEAKPDKTVMAVFEGIPDEIAVERFKFLEDSLPQAQLARVIVHPGKEEVFVSGENKGAVQVASALLEKSSYYINH